MILDIWGLSLSMRTSWSITIAWQTFFRTSTLSSLASENRPWWVEKKRLFTQKSSKVNKLSYLNKIINVIHQSLVASDYKLIYTRNSVRSERKTVIFYIKKSIFYHMYMKQTTYAKKRLNSNLILGLEWLKNCKNFGIITFKDCCICGDSNNSTQSSQTFCKAPKAPWKKNSFVVKKVICRHR